jgi:hypothetical protein
MKAKMIWLIMFCLFAGLVAGFAPMAVDAQETSGQEPILLIKIRNIDQFQSDVEKIMPPTEASKAGPQIAMFRGMLQGTDWIDPERSIVGGMIMEAQKTVWVMVFPFRQPNPNFQKSLSAVAGPDYYVAAFPPQPELAVNPAVEQSLVAASKAPADSNVVLEMAAARLLAMADPQMAALTKKLEDSPAPKTGPANISPQQIQTMMAEMLKTLKQIDLLRLGFDLSGDIFTLQFDVDALPNTPLAGVLTDLGGNTRVMDFQVDMPIQFRSRAHDMFGILDLMKAEIDPIYQQMGISLADMEDIIKVFTGEMSGGMKVASDGFTMEGMMILQPGTNGEDFLHNTYMPWFERYNKQITEALAKAAGKPTTQLYERTADSTVAGLKVVGIRTNISSIVPPEEQKKNPFLDQPFEMRLAAVNDLLFFASNDATMESLISRGQNLASIPAKGPTVEFEIELGAFFRDIQSMIPAKDGSIPWPEDPGKLSIQSEMRDGKLITRTSINIAEMSKLMSAIQSRAASKAETPPAD